MKILLPVIAVLFSCNAFANPLKWANGEWGIAEDYEPENSADKIECETAPLRVSVDISGKIFSSSHGTSGPRKAKIIKSNSGSLTILYDNEKRLMDSGKPHVWNMVFLTKDSFVWVRQDWIVDGVQRGSTKVRYRCESPDIS